MDFASRFLILISNEKNDNMNHNKASAVKWALATAVRRPPLRSCTFVGINHILQSHIHLQDLVRPLSSLLAIYKTATY